MRYRSFQALQRELSLLVLGTAYLSLADLEGGFELLDRWVELGGNVLDSAHSYGVFAGGERGDAERVLGRWLEARPGLRERIVVISKGGHPNQDRNRVTPEDVTSDLRDTLARLHTDYIDVYMLHRDDPALPVGPIVDVLNEHLQAGRIRCFGASNWTMERIDEAAAYAADHGLESFSCSSCNLALATQSEPMWPGSLSVSDPISLRWHTQRQLPLFSWSSQAGGYFALDEARIAANSDLTRVYDSPENRERRARAVELGEARGFSANEVALAWTLAQRFPTYAIIGPRTVDELHGSLRGLDVDLSEEDATWLSLGADGGEKG
jgi:aryl-alcohol dehydrogenase-like predicted oxidoreductase